MQDIADQRGVVNLRNGSKSKLLEDLRKHVSYIAELRLSMSWRNYKRGATTVFLEPDRPTVCWILWMWSCKAGDKRPEDDSYSLTSIK